MESTHRARTGTWAAMSLRLLLPLGVLLSFCGAVYLPEDGPPLPLTDGLSPAEHKNPTDDGVLTVIPGKIKPPPSERIPDWSARDNGCVEPFFARTKRDTQLQVTETEDAVITDIIHMKPAPVRQIIRQPSRSPKFVCPEEWRGLDLTDPSVLECPENATGFFPFPPDCRKYLNCWRGRSTVQPCAPATFFDPVRRECDYPEKVKCLPDCFTGRGPHQTRPSQDIEDAESGNNNNANYDGENNNGFEGNRKSISCVYWLVQNTLATYTGTYTDSYSDTQHNEGFGARNPNNRGNVRPGYHDLSHNNHGAVTDGYGSDPTLIVDPNNPSGHSPLLDVRDFSQGKVSRVRPNSANQPRNQIAHADVASQREHRTSRSRRYVYSSTSSKYCPMEGGTGLAPDPDDCSRFYNCAQGRGYRMDCASGTLFSERINNCDHSHLVNCGSRPRQRNQGRTPFSPPALGPYDSSSVGSGRQEVHVAYQRPTNPPYNVPSGRNINYQPSPPRNPDAGYQPDYRKESNPTGTPKPVFFQPQHSDHTNHQRPDHSTHFQHSHPSHEHFQHNHPPGTPFQHNHPPHEPFQHNHPPGTPFQHNHPPNTHFQHNHPPHQSPYSPHNRTPFTHNQPAPNSPHHNPTHHPQTNPPFNTALNPTHNHPSYNPQKGSPTIPEQNPVPAPPKDEDNYDQYPQGSSVVGYRRPNQVSYGSSSTPKSVESGKQGPKWDPRRPEYHPPGHPANPRDPHARDERWNILPETGEAPTPCPTTNEPIEGEADKEAWINLVNKTRSARTPMAGQWVRLRGGQSSLEGQVEILGPGAVWGGVCDADGAWNIEKASIVCRQLGFERGAETSWQGGFRSNKPSHVNSVTCGEGAPSLLHCALQRGWDEYACDTLTRAANVRCLPNWSSKCQPGETLRGDRCYRLFKPSVEMIDLAQSASEAVEHCRSRGGHIVDVNSQAENDFLTDWLATEHPDVDAILTSGIGVRVNQEARDLWIWQTDNYSPMGYSKWWPGWNGTNVSTPNVGDKTMCVILKKKYPCDGRHNEICSAEYMYWHAVDCALRDTLYPYICERKGDNIGCVDRAAEYTGSANVTANGRSCLPWDDERVISAIRYRISDQNRREILNGHNYCRKVYSNREPWCYVDYGHGIEIRSEDCQIPPCWDRGTNTNNSTTRDSSTQTDTNELRESGTGNREVHYSIPWKYASRFPHAVFAAVFVDDDEENTLEPDQGGSASEIFSTAEIPYDPVTVVSSRPTTVAWTDGRIKSTTIKPGVPVPGPGVSQRPTWSRARKNRNERFTTPAPTVTPAPTIESDHTGTTVGLNTFDEIFADPLSTQTSDQYPSYIDGPLHAGIQTIGEIPHPLRGPKSHPHIFLNPQYPQVRQYTQRPPKPQQPEASYTDPPFPQVTPPNPTNIGNFQNSSPQTTLYPKPLQVSQTPQNSQTTQNPQTPKPISEIPLDVDDVIPNQLVNNPVMPPSYPDGRPPIPSDEKPPISSRGGLPGRSQNPAQESELLSENEPREDVQGGVTSFNELLRILHQRYGSPSPPQFLNGHTGPMGWYSPSIPNRMIGPVRSARSPENGETTLQNAPFRSDANETENIMKIPRQLPKQKGSDESIPRYFM